MNINEAQVKLTGVRRTTGVDGFSLVEAMVAVAVIGIALGAMMTLNGQQLRMVKVSRDTNAASLYQQERIEQLRQVRWPDLASASYIADTYLNERPASRAALDRISEQIKITPYPEPVSGGKALKISQQPGANAIIDTTLNGYGLVNERLVKVDMTLAWRGPDGRSHERSTVTLISNSGVTRNSLPALGGVSGGGNWSIFEPTGPTTTPEPEAPEPDLDPTRPHPSNNGNGGGRGNTGGKGGQG